MLTNTRAMTSSYRLQQWAEIIQKQQESGLKVRAFCKEFGIKEQRYYYWQRKLRVAANDKLTKSQNETTDLVPTKNETPVVWAEVKMEELPVVNSPNNNSIKICREGWTVLVESEFDIELLAKALQAVSRLCC